MSRKIIFSIILIMSSFSLHALDDKEDSDYERQKKIVNKEYDRDCYCAGAILSAFGACMAISQTALSFEPTNEQKELGVVLTGLAVYFGFKTYHKQKRIFSLMKEKVH